MWSRLYCVCATSKASPSNKFNSQIWLDVTKSCRQNNSYARSPDPSFPHKTAYQPQELLLTYQSVYPWSRTVLEEREREREREREKERERESEREWEREVHKYYNTAWRTMKETVGLFTREREWLVDRLNILEHVREYTLRNTWAPWVHMG